MNVPQFAYASLQEATLFSNISIGLFGKIRSYMYTRNYRKFHCFKLNFDSHRCFNSKFYFGKQNFHPLVITIQHRFKHGTRCSLNSMSLLKPNRNGRNP